MSVCFLRDILFRRCEQPGCVKKEIGRCYERGTKRLVVKQTLTENKMENVMISGNTKWGQLLRRKILWKGILKVV